MSVRDLWFVVCGLVLCCGCADEEVGEGVVAQSIYGESFIEDGIPAEELADGWALTFESFEVTLGEVVVGSARFTPTEAVELTVASEGEGHALREVAVGEGSHEASYTLKAVQIRGRAVKGEVVKTFEWGFDQEVEYRGCEGGVRVSAGEPASYQITIHADHLFYDSLVSEEPALRFEALAAADGDGDGEITRAELEAASVGSYDVGNAQVDDLWGYLEAQSLTLGHFNGEGHCDARVR